MVWNESKFVEEEDIERHASDSMQTLKQLSIFDPFSNSNDPLFHDKTPCCIHLGKFS